MKWLGRVSNLRWKVVTLLVAPITFVMTLDRAAMTVAASTIQKEFGLTIVEMSLILTVYFWTYALGQNRVLDRYSVFLKCAYGYEVDRGAEFGKP